MSKRVLITAAVKDVESVLEKWNIAEMEVELLHLPLEKYLPLRNDGKIVSTLNNLEVFENIVYGNVRNTLFFLDAVKKEEKLEKVRDRVNLTLDEKTSDVLEAEGIPAICSYAGSNPIDLIEFMLRFKRLDTTLYPCGSHKKEEVPGFLEELDIPVTELELFDLEGPDEKDLAAYREKVQSTPPDAIIFHSRRSVTRTLAAFQSLDFGELKIISADKGISRKLEDKDIDVHAEGKGSWESIISLI